MPDWVRNYMAPGEATRFSVDQFIEGLSYAPTVEAEDLPAWSWHRRCIAWVVR